MSENKNKGFKKTFTEIARQSNIDISKITKEKKADKNDKKGR